MLCANYIVDLRIALLCRRVGKKEQESAEATDFPFQYFPRSLRWEKKGEKGREIVHCQKREKAFFLSLSSPPL